MATLLRELESIIACGPVWRLCYIEVYSKRFTQNAYFFKFELFVLRWVKMQVLITEIFYSVVKIIPSDIWIIWLGVFVTNENVYSLLLLEWIFSLIC